MREILFRGWDEKNKEMVYDINLLFSNHLNECFEEYEECGLKIMQYTGFKDKNGVKIFEGDIVNLKYPRDRRYKVVAKVINGQEISAMVLKFDNDFTTEEFPLYKISAENNLEVIGNIHEGV